MKQGILNFFKKILNYIEPEGIPFPGSIIYNKIMQNFDLYDLLLHKIAKSDLISNIKGTILDVGTGPAYLPIYITQNNPACKVIGLDVSSGMIRLASQNIQKANLLNAIYLKKGNVSKLPFPDQFFDFIISTGSFHHWKLPINAFNEIYRVLKYNSEAWIFDAINPLPREEFLELCQRFGKLKIILFYLHTFSEPFYEPQKIYRIIQKSKFEKGELELFSILYRINLSK